jgi:hypothetical protein
VDKISLLEVVKNCEASSDDANQILSLREKYPFSQVLQVLSAKLSKDHHLPAQQSALQRAAIYSTDRQVLKDIMTGEFEVSARVISTTDVMETTASPEVIEPVVSVEKRDIAEPEITEREKLMVADTIGGIDLADTVLLDLKRLHESKHNFEMLFADQTAVSFVATPPVDTEFKTKKEKIIEFARSAALEEKENPAVVSKRKRKESPVESIIDEIKTTKEEIEPESERQKEQIQLIDHFIKTQPSIVNPKDRNPTPVTDLNSIRSGEFGDNIVSETLVEILVKQGKKERAIEVLKKLIWKYPQKKAYFASQIEDLKK